MQEISSNVLVEKLKSGEITYDNIYDFELELSQYKSIEYFKSHQKDTVDINQNLHIVFGDIECYSYNRGDFKPDLAKSPITCITWYSTFKKEYHSFFLVLPIVINKITPMMIPSIEEEFTKEFKELVYKDKKDNNQHYLESDEKVVIHLYNNEIMLLTDAWNIIHEWDPAVLSGAYFDTFDLPYMFNRLKEILNDDKKAMQILSKFGVVKIRKMGTRGITVQVADYPILDIVHLYKPRSEGGLNYGKSQPSYSLDWISDDELGIKKLAYKNEGLSLDAFYEQDPINYLKYNIIDVILPKKLNEKLQHIDLHNLLRRDMKTPMTISLRGSSALFDTFFSYDLNKQGYIVRYGITQENSLYLSESDIAEIPKPKTKSTKWDITKVDVETYKIILNKFIGAYVKDAANKLCTEKDGIHIDLDATALYPSMMLQNNISFDTFYGRVLDPICYPLIQMLYRVLGTNEKFIPDLHNKVFEQVVAYVDKLDPNKPKKSEYKQALYYILMHKLYKLKQINKPLKQLFTPSNREDYLTLKTYLIPALDLWKVITPSSQEFNTFAYDYLLNQDITNYKFIFVIENANSPKLKIAQYRSDQINSYLKQNNVSLNITGCLFYTHAKHIGLVYQFLNDRLDMRKFYKNKMYEFEVGSEEYKFYNTRQLTMKVNANSSYGLMGMTNFRFSSKFLAESITVSGRVALKVAQKCGDIYIKSKYD